MTDRAALEDDAFTALLHRLSGAGGLTVQLREKGTPDRDVVEWAGVCRRTLGPDVPLYVNRRFDLALAAGADGVHLPADGLPLDRVRANTPRGFRVGVSSHSAGEAARALDAGADLVVLGPIFDTPSKRAFGPPLGPAALADIPPRPKTAGGEVYVIGGIDEDNLGALAPFRDRFDGVAGIRLFQEASDPRRVVERLASR